MKSYIWTVFFGILAAIIVCFFPAPKVVIKAVIFGIGIAYAVLMVVIPTTEAEDNSDVIIQPGETDYQKSQVSIGKKLQSVLVLAAFFVVFYFVTYNIISSNLQ